MGAYLAELLVIEDDQVLSAQLGELLRLQGYAVRLSPLGESGLAMALASAPDLVLLDVMLPDVSGFSVLRRLREQQQTPVIMLTACGAEEERIRGLRHGADDYLAKPFNLTELQLRIDAMDELTTMGRASIRAKDNSKTLCRERYQHPGQKPGQQQDECDAQPDNASDVASEECCM